MSCFPNIQIEADSDSAGLAGDRTGRLNILWPMTLASGCLCLFLWLLGTSIPTLVLFISMYGFFSSSMAALPPSVVGQITPDEKLGARIGIFYSRLAVASLGGTPIAGTLITDAKSRRGYRWLILFSVSSVDIYAQWCALASQEIGDRINIWFHSHASQPAITWPRSTEEVVNA